MIRQIGEHVDQKTDKLKKCRQEKNKLPEHLIFQNMNTWKKTETHKFRKYEKCVSFDDAENIIGVWWRVLVLCVVCFFDCSVMCSVSCLCCCCYLIVTYHCVLCWLFLWTHVISKFFGVVQKLTFSRFRFFLTWPWKLVTLAINLS